MAWTSHTTPVVSSQSATGVVHACAQDRGKERGDDRIYLVADWPVTSVVLMGVSVYD